MSTIINIANELSALQGRITADKAALLEAKAMMEREYSDEISSMTEAHLNMKEALDLDYSAAETRIKDRHARLMAFIDGQIAAKDEAIEGEPAPIEF